MSPLVMEGPKVKLLMQRYEDAASLDSIVAAAALKLSTIFRK